MSYELIIRHCAPTLAGIKIGSLFSCQYDCEEQLHSEVKKRNHLLNNKGIVFQILRHGQGTALIYVYRPKQLSAHLQHYEVAQFLREQGYHAATLSAYLQQLQSHLSTESFPHEIGIFLGYPIGDIRGFMEHKGEHCKCTGCWKVYTDEVSAQRTFARYKRCTNVYYQRYIDGIDITQLTVAG